MKNFCCLAAIGFILLLPGLISAGVPPPGVEAAAEAGLDRFLNEVISPSELINFGFAAGENTAGASLGEPWPLYTITPAALKAATEETMVESLVTTTGLWYFPVVLGGSPRCVITVAQMDGEWAAVSIGKASLAPELGKISRRWPKASGYDPRLIVVYQAASYFFTVPEKDARNLTPLTTDGAAFGVYQKTGAEYSSTAELSDLLDPLKEAVEANIAAHRAAGRGGGE